MVVTNIQDSCSTGAHIDAAPSPRWCVLPEIDWAGDPSEAAGSQATKWLLVVEGGRPIGTLTLATQRRGYGVQACSLYWGHSPLADGRRPKTPSKAVRQE